MTTAQGSPPPQPNRYWVALKDWGGGAIRVRLWTVLAWHELSLRYKRTWIGVGWISLSFALFTAAKIFVFSTLSGTSTAAFSIHLILGYLVFRLLSAFVNGGSSVFVSAQNWIKSEPLPLSIHLYRLAATNFISFAFAAIPAFLATVYLQVAYMGGIHSNFVLSILPASLMYVAFGLCVAMIVGTYCTRYRDILHFVATFMQILYFITPILWVAPESGPRAILAHINPLTHFVDILRQPAIDGNIPYDSWMIASASLIVLFVVGILSFGHYRSKIVYWL